MNTELSWKYRIFKNAREIYSKKVLIGTLRDLTWTQSAKGEINGKKYKFKTKGFFKHKTQIIDPATDFIIGKITYNNWMTKAKIEYLDKVVHWKYSNFWNTKWRLSDSAGIEINFHGSSSRGKIESDNPDDVLILAGLFIANYNWQYTITAMSVILIASMSTIL